MQIHKLADTYPMLSEAELQKLADSIRDDGQKDPIVLTSDGVLLDGRNRLAACKLASVKPRMTFTAFSSSDDAACTSYVERANMRRHMTMDQEVMRRVLFGLPRDFTRGANEARYDKAEAVVKANATVARDVLAGRVPLMVAHNTVFRKPRQPREAKPKTEKYNPDDADAVLARAREKAEESTAKRELKALTKELETFRSQRALWSSLAAQPLPPVEPFESTFGLREGAIVAMASDWHIEELVRPQTASANAYCLSIADLRIKRFFAAILWHHQFASQAFTLRNLVLWLGGDMISGYLHEENLETSQLAPQLAIRWVQPRILAGIRSLLESGLFERIDLVCSYGNHGRTSKRMQFTTGAGQNLEWGMYQTIAEAFEGDPRIHVLADESEHQYHTVYGKRLHFHHGHRVNYGGGVGGIMIPVNKAVSQWDKWNSADLHHFGHFHQYIDHGSIVINGSLIGPNGYALGIKATPEPPQQALYILDSKRGKSLRSPIWVSDPNEERKLWEQFVTGEQSKGNT